MIDRRLAVLRMVAACGTVTGAAEALHYTPSAVSQQLRTLAKDLGVDLVVQDGRRIRLTSAARVLLEETENLYARWEEIRGLIAAADDGDVGVLRLCGFSTAASALLPRVAVHLRETRPTWQVRIIEVSPQKCFELLLADQADIAVVVATAELPSTNDPRFELSQLLVDPLDLLLPQGHPLASNTHVRLADLVDEPWIMDTPGTPYHQLLQTACVAAGFTPAVAHYASTWDTGAALVAAGLGIALIPRLAHLPVGYPVKRVSLSGDPASSRRIVTAIRRGSKTQPAITAAIDSLNQIAQDMQSGQLLPPPQHRA
jgi:DNA-binding transcriptional LysR family regulator